MENKFSRYLLYGLGEIVLVVIGIFIAIQLNKWQTVVNNQKKEKAFLVELHKESESNLQQFENNKKAYFETLDACNVVLRNAPSLEEPASRDSVLRYGPVLFRGITFDPSNGIIESLINTGNIQLIRNDTLRNYLITWKDVVKDFKEEEMDNELLLKNHVEPFLINNADFINPSSPRNVEMLKDPRFLNMVARRKFYTLSILNAMDRESIERNLNEIVRLSRTD